MDKKGWRNLASGLQPGFGNDDSKDFYQLLFLLFFRGHSYAVKGIGHALGWQLKGRTRAGNIAPSTCGYQKRNKTPALVRLQEIQVLSDAHDNFTDLKSSILLIFPGFNKSNQTLSASFLAQFSVHMPYCLHPDAILP